jgi:hypothetical protein
MSLEILDKIECDKGRINEENKYDDDKLLGEYFDVYCVIRGKKPLASLDDSPYGRNKAKKRYNVNLINKIFDLGEKHNLMFIHNKMNKSYLKTIFFLEKNMYEAIILSYVLWADKYDKLESFMATFYIGYLLGYDIKNIKYIYKRNFNYILTDEKIKEGIAQLNKIDVKEVTKMYKNSKYIVISNKIKRF